MSTGVNDAKNHNTNCLGWWNEEGICVAYDKSYDVIMTEDWHALFWLSGVKSLSGKLGSHKYREIVHAKEKANWDLQDMHLQIWMLYKKSVNTLRAQETNVKLVINKKEEFPVNNYWQLLKQEVIKTLNKL